MTTFETLEARTHLASVPSGFSESSLASGLVAPTGMTLAPDGRVFITQQAGQLRVVKNGQLLAEPFFSLRVDSRGERGLLGVAVDPDYTANHYVYVYYTVPARRRTAAHNRVSRFTASGDVALKRSEKILLEITNLSSATNHNGGAIAFGPDGKLYVATGDNANGANAQSIKNLLGKILRINADGSIPGDNPFYSKARGANKAIWAIGLRNPFSFSFQGGTGLMYINDVGLHSYEEIDQGAAGVNYGWPETEGPTRRARFSRPVLYYAHGIGPTTGEAIVGSTFYTPTSRTFPVNYAGDYFFADLGSGWIRRLDPVTRDVASFASGISVPVALATANDGSLYYLARGTGDATGELVRIQYTG